jgi:mannosyl-oligosaccharide glucosidase
VSQYEKMATKLSKLGPLNRMHYDPKAGQYRDWGNHTEDVRLEWRYVDVPVQWQSQVGSSRRRLDMVRHVGRPPIPSFVPHFG